MAGVVECRRLAACHYCPAAWPDLAAQTAALYDRLPANPNSPAGAARLTVVSPIPHPLGAGAAA